MRRLMLLFSGIFLLFCTGCGEDAQGQAMHGEDTQGQTTSEQSALEGNAQGQTTPEQATREEDAPEQNVQEQTTPEQAVPGQTSPTENGSTAEDDGAVFMPGETVLLTKEATLADGRSLTLEAVGKELDEYSWGVREVRVYDEGMLIQTVLAADAGEDDPYDTYTSCWTAEDTMEVLDLNFDGNADFGLFGWVPNNTIPYHYWTWDEDAGQYAYACTLQGVELHPETGEVSAEYKSGGAGAAYTSDYFSPNEDGKLCMVRREISDWTQSKDSERPALEIQIPREDVEIPAKTVYASEVDLMTVRREIPTAEIHADGSVSYYTEIWEFGDGGLQLTGKEEYGYE